MLSWAKGRYGLPEDVEVARPFWPGRDYASEEYPEGCVVVDNPPFSKMHDIVGFYMGRGVRFFLFANHLTLFSSLRLGCNAVVVGINVLFENGAEIPVSFLTNLGGRKVEVSGGLWAAIEEAQRRRASAAPVRTLRYPANVTTAARLARFARLGMELELDARPLQRVGGERIFGGGVWLPRLSAARLEAARLEAATLIEPTPEESERFAEWEEECA